MRLIACTLMLGIHGDSRAIAGDAGVEGEAVEVRVSSPRQLTEHNRPV